MEEKVDQGQPQVSARGRRAAGMLFGVAMALGVDVPGMIDRVANQKTPDEIASERAARVRQQAADRRLRRNQTALRNAERSRQGRLRQHAARGV